MKRESTVPSQRSVERLSAAGRITTLPTYLKQKKNEIKRSLHCTAHSSRTFFFQLEFLPFDEKQNAPVSDKAAWALLYTNKQRGEIV